jgi:hypothetical protein
MSLKEEDVLGCLEKMSSSLADPVLYHLRFGEDELALNPLIGQHLELHYTGNIFCVHCGKKTAKSFNQGYCYPCFIRLAQCDMCILKPETCHYAAGTCREPAWAETFCFQPHLVYLANSSGVKVGITRKTQVPTRWIDQGAVQALPIAAASSRQISGLMEVALAEYISDKTSWQQMLKNQVSNVGLTIIRDELLARCAHRLQNIREEFGETALILLPEAESIEIHYPVQHYPSKINSFNLDKNPDVSGVLNGIKGQYLLLDSGVINIRKFTGYEVAVIV